MRQTQLEILQRVPWGLGSRRLVLHPDYAFSGIHLPFKISDPPTHESFFLTQIHRLWPRRAKFGCHSLELPRAVFAVPAGGARPRRGLRRLFARRSTAYVRWCARGSKNFDMGHVQRVYCGHRTTRSRPDDGCSMGGYGQVRHGPVL